jgi:hypothetical protein
MENLKNTVLEYLRKDRGLTGGRNIYNKLTNKSLALQNSFARMTNTDANRSRLCYELAKAVGIEERQLTIILQKPIEKGEIQDTKPKDLPIDTPGDRLISFSPETTDYFQAKKLVKELELTVTGKKKEDLYSALAEARKAQITQSVTDLPANIKASVKLRDQFPFLREKDCPDSLKLLVNDLITSYEKFAAEQPKLHEVLSDADAAATAEIVLENYIANKEAWAELEHYKENGNILGAHPLFARLALKEEIAALTTVELVKKIKSLEINLIKNRKKENAELVERDEDLLAYAKSILEKR